MSGNPFFDGSKTLKWSEELGVGFLRLHDTPYDAAYFEKYVGYAKTEFGKRLTEERCDLTEIYCNGLTVVDIGIGSGQFMNAYDCFGFDVNPVAVKMLIESERYFDPYSNIIQCATFWDSLEHIQDIHRVLANISEYIVVSIPIFRDVDHVRSSKHYRPDEHCWYFTREGFERFIAAHGFNVIHYNEMETSLGREDIGTFVCKRDN